MAWIGERSMPRSSHDGTLAVRSSFVSREELPHQQSRAGCPEEKSQVRSVKSDYVMFPSDTYTLLDDSHLRRAFRRVMKVVRLENFHFMISGIPSRRGLCNPGSISTRSNAS